MSKTFLILLTSITITNQQRRIETTYSISTVGHSILYVVPFSLKAKKAIVVDSNKVLTHRIVGTLTLVTKFRKIIRRTPVIYVANHLTMVKLRHLFVYATQYIRIIFCAESVIYCPIVIDVKNGLERF